MARHKNLDWNLLELQKQSDGSFVCNVETIHAALLMDIRDELKRLNALLHCGNFIDIPHKLERIAYNTVKPKKKAKLKLAKKRAA